MGKFEDWQKKNPTKTFKDFFSERTEKKLRDGRPHASLGENLLGEYDYGSSGERYFRKLQRFGLEPDSTCVDYGCGTLRVGIHVINYLGAGRYWGFDISDFLLEEGRKLIGEEVWAAKQPNLRVISPQSVAEAAAAKPTMLFSFKVLIHVPPDTLPEYVGNIMDIIGTTGQAIISGRWTETKTEQYSNQGWLHTRTSVEDLVKSRGGTLRVLKEEDCKVEKLNQMAKSGSWRIASAELG